MAENSGAEIGSNAGNPEVNTSPEGDSRKSVIDAFSYAKSKFIEGIATKPRNQLSETDQEDQNSLNGAFYSDEHRVGADLKKQKFTYTNKITDPNGRPDYIQEEGLPVEGLISFLETKLVGLRNGNERNKVQRTLDILERNSETYEKHFPDQKIDIDTGAGEVDNPVMFARKRQESKFASLDHRATGSLEGDYDKALKTLRHRRMLVVPPKEIVKLKPQYPQLSAHPQPELITSPQEVPALPRYEDEDQEKLSAPLKQEQLNAPTRREALPPPEKILALPPHEEPEENQQPQTPSGIPADRDLYNVLEPEESDGNQEEPEVQTRSGIPNDQILRDVEEPEEDEEEETVTPVITTTSQPGQITPPQEVPVLVAHEEPERVSIDMVNMENPVGNETSLQAKKDINERLSRGKLWEFWRWPAKLALRLSQSGVENIQQGRLRKTAIENGSYYSSLSSVTEGAAAVNEALAIKSEEQGQAVLERMRQGRIVEERRANGQIIEDRRLIEGDLKTAIMNDIIAPLIQQDHKDINDNPDTITGTPREQANEVRKRMSAFVREHLVDTEANKNVRELFGADANDYGYVAESFATDILERAQVIKTNMEKHNKNLDQYSQYVDLHFGLVRGLYNTDARSFTDRGVAWARKRQSEHLVRGVQEVSKRSGWILNPAVVGIGMSLATEGLMRGIGSGSRVATGLTGPLAGLMGGAAVAAARRYVEIGGHRKMQNAELAMGEAIPERQHAGGILGKLYERTAGMYRREDLVQFRYDSIKATELINGSDEPVSDPADRNYPKAERKLRSVDQLLSLPLNDQASKEAVAGRMAEIRTRIKRGQIDRVDLITYSDKTKVNQELNQLYEAADKLETALKESGTDFVKLQTDADTYWQNAFTLDQQRKDKAFNAYRWKQTGGSALMGGTMGLAAGIGVQQGAAEIARHFNGAAEIPVIGGMFKPGQTLAEKGIHTVGSAIGHTELGTGPVSVDSFVDLYKNGGSININDNIMAKANPDHTISYLYRANGQPALDFPPTSIKPDGHLIASGDPTHLPEGVKNWSNSEIGLRKQIAEAVSSGENTTILAGDAKINIMNSDVTVAVDGDTVSGKIGPNSVLNFSTDNEAALEKAAKKLWPQGFQDVRGLAKPDLTASRSILDEVKDAFNEPGLQPRLVRIPNLGNVTITPQSGEILIQPSTGPLAGTEIPGIFKSDGSLHLDMPPGNNLDLKEVQQILEKTGFTGIKVEDTADQITTREIPGQEIPGETITKDVLDYFRNQKPELNMVEKANRVEFLNNGTPEFDKAELRLWLNANPDGTVDIDMSHMIRFNTLPEDINNDIITNADGSKIFRNMEFLITPNDAADQTRDVIKIVAGEDGHYKLPPGSDLNKFFKIENGKVVQLARFIETAHLKRDDAGNILGRSIIATSVGEKGVGQITTTTPTTLTPTKYFTGTNPGIHTLDATLPDTHTYTLGLKPPFSTEIIPPPTVESALFIPIPSERMHPLEPMYTEYLYSSTSRSAEWQKEAHGGFSPNLLNNPDYIPRPSIDIPWYLENQRQKNPDYFRQLEQLNSQVAQQMHPDCEMATCIAVAGHQEDKNIYRTLQTLQVQRDTAGKSVWDSNNHEVMLFVNWPQGTSPQNTLKEIERFQQDYKRETGKDFPLRIFKYEVTNGKKELGLYKKMTFDLALLRHHQTAPNKELYITMNDADMVYTNPRYLNGMLSLAKEPQKSIAQNSWPSQLKTVDAILGRQDLDPEIYEKFPTFHAAMRYFEFMDSVVRSTSKSVYTQGRNTVIKGSTYAAIGGNRTTDFNADVEFGDLIKLARNYQPTILYSNANWVMVDPRREIGKFLKGEPVAGTWSDFNSFDVRGTNLNFGAYSDVDVEKLQNNPEEIAKFEDRLTKEINILIKTFAPGIEGSIDLAKAYCERLGIPPTSTTEEIISKSLRFLGVNPKLQTNRLADGSISAIEVILKDDAHPGINTENLRTGLKRYKDEERKNTKIKNNPLLNNQSPANVTLPTTLPITQENQQKTVGQGAPTIIVTPTSVQASVTSPVKTGGSALHSEMPINLTPEYNFRNLSNSERSSLQKLAKDGSPDLTNKLLTIPEFLPTGALYIDGQEFLVGKVIKTYERDEAVMFYKDPISKRLIPRALYKSKSDGGWRSCPGIRDNLYIKGNGIHYTQETKPHESIIRYLEESETKGHSVEYKNKGETVITKYFTINRIEPKPQWYTFDDEVKQYDDRSDLSQFQQYPPGYYRKKDIGNETSLSNKFRAFDFSTPAMRQFIPDFSQPPFKTDHFKHTLLGNVNTASYTARLHGRPIQWVMAYDRQGRVWIDRISFLDTTVNSYGVAPEVINSGALTNKPIEYRTITDGLRVGDEYRNFNADYVDITPLLDNLLPIQQFRRARGIAVERIARTIVSPTPTITPNVIPETIRQKGTLLEKMNRAIEASSTQETTFETSPQTVVDYLKTIELPQGSTIKQANTQITGNQLNINGVIDTLVGQVKFTADLSADQSGTLKVIRHKVDLPFFAQFSRGAIENQITNLNQIITDQINRQIDPTWEVGGIKIINGKLAFDFRKKTNL